MLLYTGLWGALALALVALAFYRKFKAREEDDTLHVSGGNWNVMDKQEHVAHSMEQIDKWGKILTVVAVLYGLTLLAFYLNSVFVQGAKLAN
jgi:hypothetical protein